jgi:gliding motility-associated-like protein
MNNNTMSKLHILLLVSSLVLLSFVSAFASHIRAGEITASRISADSLKWRFQLTVYTDINGNVVNDEATIDFGDGTSQTVRIKERKNLPDYKSYINIYVVEHTFSSPGIFIVKYNEQNRNGGVLNISSSDQNSFYIETKVVIDPGLAQNSTPHLAYPPLDIAPVGQIFEHNPGAYDPDGDSISYRMVVPRQKYNGVVMPVAGYRDPAEFGGTSMNGGATTFILDEKTGYMTWDTPNVIGEYNVAFEIIEWRKVPDRDNPGQLVYRQIGYVVRDMQILVKDANNKRPELKLPMDTCIVAGTFVDKIITATDPDSHLVTISAYGGPFVAKPDTASFKSTPRQSSPASGTFTWQTSCMHVRNQPYEVLFRAEDHPPIISQSLVDLQTYRITVVGPPPTGLTATPVNDTIKLTWDPYICTNAATIEIYRKEGKSLIEPQVCPAGIPAGDGFIKVGEVPASRTGFNDFDRPEVALMRGIEYCYRIVAVFPEPAGGLSVASDTACARLIADVPLMMKVSVLSTDSVDGSMDVKWTSPFELDTTAYPGPYRYKLFRAEGKEASNFIEVATMNSLKDTTFTDTGLNTARFSYKYRVAFYVADTSFKDSSDIASSVWLSYVPEVNQIRLEWSADVPWDNNNSYHTIYRETDGQMVEIAKVLAQNNQFTYTDKGSDEAPIKCNVTYAYYVLTEGKYHNPLLPEVIRNNSQRIEAAPMDTTKLAAPILALDTPGCGSCSEFTERVSLVNSLSWHTPDSLTSNECYPEVAGYNIYFTPHEEDSLEFLAFTPNLDFAHEDLFSLAGCYEVEAVDIFGRVGPRSNRVCNDNCEFYELPNVFTPNEDLINDDFRPICFGGEGLIESIKFTVYNRWGRRVYSSENDVLLKWQGITNEGAELPAGTYFYMVDIKFKKLKKNDGFRTLKGWVQILR